MLVAVIEQEMPLPAQARVMNARSKKSKAPISKQNADPGNKKGDLITSLAPLQIIRTETVISKMPIHNLVKGGDVNIQISQKNEQGRVTLHWEISPSTRFGHPGQLAYKLDTIIINRIIDEIGRPVPRLIKIGTLNQLCQELGSQKAELKKSLQQNAATTISAKLHYKSNDGKERKLEATFSRYSVIFTGETLPNGEKADEIYVIFNDPYLEVLNSAPIRPLNYEYLKELAPTSQRFYEIISYRVYTSIKYGYPQAKLLYSEYCTYSAQRRHDDFERVRVQMYRVHKPHLESTYITKVEFEECVDEAGAPDWVIYYTPGPKAKAEFQTFNSKQSSLYSSKPDDLAPVRMLAGEQQLWDEGLGESPSYGPAEIDLVKHFHRLARGKSDYQPGEGSRELVQAAALLAKHGVEKARHIVEFAIREAKKTNFQMRMFGAVLQYADDAIDAYEKRIGAEQGREGKEQSEASQLQGELDEYQRAEQKLDSLSEDEFKALYDRIRTDLLTHHAETIRRFDGAALEATIRAGMLKSLREESL